MITAFLLMPVVAVLVWVYWCFLPKKDHQASRWHWVDSMLLVFLTLMSGGFVWLSMHSEGEAVGPIWPEVVSAVGVYFIFTIGLSAGLAWRRFVRVPRLQG